MPSPPLRAPPAGKLRGPTLPPLRDRRGDASGDELDRGHEDAHGRPQHGPAAADGGGEEGQGRAGDGAGSDPQARARQQPPEHAGPAGHRGQPLPGRVCAPLPRRLPGDPHRRHRRDRRMGALAARGVPQRPVPQVHRLGPQRQGRRCPPHGREHPHPPVRRPPQRLPAGGLHRPLLAALCGAHLRRGRPSGGGVGEAPGAPPRRRGGRVGPPRRGLRAPH
mmetsp:Transcript_20536/g.48897  ORF Transcript_20536/g.48897 Transcript_20536/m.48897 type:complete len:221 (+) Transcript_20536:987-1649(+)